MLTVTVASPPGSANGAPMAAADLLGERDRIGASAERLEEDHELVAADAGDRVGGSKALGEPLCDPAEHQVADVMPPGIIDPLEAVEVDEEDREARRVPRGPHQELVQAVEHEIAVRQPGERVVRGEMLEGDLGPLELVDLPRDAQQPHDSARRVVERRLGGQRPVHLATFEAATLRQADDRLVGFHDPRVVEHGDLAELPAEQLDIGPADELRRIGASEVQRHLPVHAHEPALTILEVDAVDHRLHQGAKQEAIVEGDVRRHRYHLLTRIGPTWRCGRCRSRGRRRSSCAHSGPSIGVRYGLYAAGLAGRVARARTRAVALSAG